MTFRPPASKLALTIVERMIGRKLPDALRQFLLLHDGQEPGVPMIESCPLLSAAQIATQHEMLLAVCGSRKTFDSSKTDEGIQKIPFAPAWIPIAQSADGRDYLCLDLDPAEGGRIGQVIRLSLEDDRRSHVAPSFRNLLALYLLEINPEESLGLGL
jgi:molybdopterin molybdotransferase